MKNTCLIFSVMLVVISLFHSLSAGPAYASKWTRDGQTVLLYGDHHKTSESDEAREYRYIDAFCEELKQVSTETLVLCEDKKALPFRLLYSDEDIQAMDTGFNKMFMFATGIFAHSISSQLGLNIGSKVRAESIEPRSMLMELLPNALTYCKIINEEEFLDGQILEEMIALKPGFKKAYEAIKDWNLATLFERPIGNIKFYSKFACDGKARNIFDEIAANLRMRKTVLWNKILADTGLSLEELDQATIAMLAIRMKTDMRYDKLATFLMKTPTLMSIYGAEMLDAEALWEIVGMEDSCKKVVVIAGFIHIRNLEKHLSILGFKQCASEGQNYVHASEEGVRALCFFGNVCDVEHSSRVFPLNPIDSFGQILFCCEINAAIKQVASLPAENLSKEQLQAFFDIHVKQQALNSFNPIPLVPLETFKWISESATYIQKSRSEDGFEELSELKKSNK